LKQNKQKIFETSKNKFVDHDEDGDDNAEGSKCFRMPTDCLMQAKGLPLHWRCLPALMTPLVVTALVEIAVKH